MFKIPFWDYQKELSEDRSEILQAFEATLDSGQLILGPQVKAFEEAFSSYCQVPFGVGVDNATNGIALGIKSLGIGAGDEVITVANTAIPTVSAIVQAGATPRFVDIDPTTALMDPRKVEEALSPQTRCILPVHLFGQCAEMEKIQEIATKHHLSLLEDCAQSHGAMRNGKRAGSMSDLSVFSFYPTKPLGGFGDGGMILTSSEKRADHLRRLRFYGIKADYHSEEQGFNSRLDEVQAAILLVKLRKLEQRHQELEKLADLYQNRFAGTAVKSLKTLSGNKHAHHLFVVQTPRRSHVMESLKKRGIETRIHYPHPIHLMKAYEKFGQGKGSLPETEKMSHEILSLPLYPGLTFDQVHEVSEQILRALS